MVLSHGARGEVAERATVDDIRIRVLGDHARGATGLQSQWGLSFWIEKPAALLRIRELAGADDPYRELGQRADEVVYGPLPELATKVKSAPAPWLRPSRPACTKSAQAPAVT